MTFTLHTLQIDIAGDFELNEILNDFYTNNISILTFLPNGPRDGNPVLTLSTTDINNFKRFLTPFTDNIQSEIDFYMEHIISH